MNADEKKTLDRTLEKRKRLVESLSRIETFIGNVTNETTVEEYAVRVEALTDIMTDFRKIDDKIMSYPDQISEIIEFESRFFDAKAQLKRLSKEASANMEDTDQQFRQTMAQLALSQTTLLEAFKGGNTKSPDLRLPKINIQPFGGKYEEFNAFKDLFESSIHSNENISNVHKFQFLKGVLRDEAASLIRHIKCTSANYEEAWSKICERYDKRKQVVSKYIQSFLEISPVTRSTQSHLRTLCNTADEVIRGLRALGTEAESRDPWLVNILLSKLDPDTRQLWSEKTLHNDFPSIGSLLKYLSERCDTIENSETISTISQINRPIVKQGKITIHHATNSPMVTRTFKCKCCQGAHPMFKCHKFKTMSIPDRREFVSSHSVCFNCLSFGHSAPACTSKYFCHYCKGKHHSLLHLAVNTVPSTAPTLPLASTTTTTLTTGLNDQSTSTHTSAQLDTQLPQPSGINQTHVAQHTTYEHLLPTAVVNVADIHGKLHQCRVLLDSGSMGNLITQSLVKKLQIPMQKSNTVVSGVSSNTTSRFKTSVTISSRIDQERYVTIDAHILPYLTAVPNETFSKPRSSRFEILDLADPQFNVRSPIDIIINAGTVFSTLLSGSIKDINISVSAQNTIFGWVLAGEIRNYTNVDSPSMTMHTCIDIHKSLQLFWKSEELNRLSILSESESKCEQLYKDTIRRSETGRIIVQLPFNDTCKDLGNSLRSAISRLRAIEAKLERNSQLKTEYHDFLSEYLSLGHMEKIPVEQLHLKEAEHYYLPHHFVHKSDSISTKLRVVFDGSCQTSSGISLNQRLLVGPTIQDDITGIVMRFRMHNIVFCADVEKMYRQILVEPVHRNYQRIVWRFDPASDIEHYQLNTVTYGTSCAPFLATRTLKQLSIDNENKYPAAANVVNNDFYVDDLLTGTDTLTEAIQLQRDIVSVLDSGGFKLRKWSSNSSKFMDNLDQSEQKQDIPIFKNKDETIKVLGIHWQPETDTFKYKVQEYSSDDVLTMRSFLSQTARLFDPFGWLSPVIINIKILFQSLWLHNITWDDALPDEVAVKWRRIQINLKSLEQIRIPRQTLFDTRLVQLHGFCDASEAASSAVIYCKSFDEMGRAQIRLLTAKTKVAPVRTISLPKLELNGALLLSRLFQQVLQAFNKHQPEVFAWCDSEIVLAWLSGQPKKWKTYVANRTSEILDTLPRKCWRHISSKDNPADLASRGIQPAELVANEFWFSGPKWLVNTESNWPSTMAKAVHTTELEQRKLNTLQTIIKANNLIDSMFNQMSSWSNLKHVVALCLRFIHNCRKSSVKQYGILTAAEMRAAEKICIKTAQQSSFSSEIIELQRYKYLKDKSKLSTLAPFLDADGILRVGGRLQNSASAYNAKHPIILHQSHILSKMIVTYHHNLFLHPSPSLLCSLLKNNYWIIGGSNLAKRESHKCIKCVRYRAKTSTQMMGTLPKARVIQSRPFTHTGIDFAGPLMLQSKRGRGAKLIKSYICVFICLSVKAIHLEVASDLSSEAFIAAFKRFVSRRGLPSDLYTDNGTNFVGAHRKFAVIFSKAELTSHYANIRRFCADRNINWHFSPPSAPHFGGVWEAAVKSMKTHLRIITGRAKLTFEEMCTLVTEIECILNSRPLYSQFTEDINSLEVITPGHFLVMGPLTAVPEPGYSNIAVNKLTRWQQVQQHVNSFWTKYHREYLNTLQQRNKWKSGTHNLSVGDLVIVKDDLPAACWGLARVIEVHPGKDGKVRVVTLKTQNTTLKRPVHKLVRMPVE